MKHTVSILILTLISTSLLGQSRNHKKWQEAIAALKASDFVKEYTNYKDIIEEQMTEFHRSKEIIQEQDIEEVRNSYNDVTKSFDNILDCIKNDFMNSTMRKMMSETPDRYTNFIAGELENAYNQYVNTVQSKVDILIENGGSIGAFDLGTIMLVVSLTNEMIKWVEKYNTRIKKMSEEYFETHFVSELRLKRFDEF